MRQEQLDRFKALAPTKQWEFLETLGVMTPFDLEREKERVERLKDKAIRRFAEGMDLDFDQIIT